jgi:hypothetical protein
MPHLPSKAKLLQIIDIQKKIAGLGLDLSSIMGLIVEEMMQLLGAEGADQRMYNAKRQAKSLQL